MRILMSAVSMVLFLNLLNAQSNALDNQADQLLQAVSAKYKQYKTAELSINLSIDLPEVEEDQTIKVKAWFKGDKFKVDLGDQIFVSDNVTMWNFFKEYNEVQISDYIAEEVLFTPSMLFDVYSEDYIYRVKEEYKNVNGEQIKVIELTPVNKDMDFFKIDLSVNQSKNTIVSSKIYERSGMRYTYEINTFTPNVSLDDSFFIFKVDEYDDIQVTDTRF